MIKSSWTKELQSSIRSYKELSSFLELPPLEIENYNCFIPVSFLKKIIKGGTKGPLWNQFIPKREEDSMDGFIDPIGDILKSKNDGIIHRYKSRILFTPTTNCPVSCRYCFRKNELFTKDKIFNQSLKTLQDYISNNKDVNEVILTGGDPLVLNEKRLEKIFKILEKENIKYLRIHSRTPIILPRRITDEFIELLQRFSDVFLRIILVIHVNHLDEIDHEVELAFKKLKKAFIEVKTQSVLLKGINDNHRDLKNLFNKIIESGATPYYLHHPDKARGAMHFYLPIEQGRKIYLKLRDELPGWAIPHYVVDHPSGSGKQLAFNPESINFSGSLLNSNADLIKY